MPVSAPNAAKPSRPAAALVRRPVVLLQQDEAFGPGRLVRQLADYGIPTEVVRLDRGASVPADLDACRCVIVLGGDASVTDGSDAVVEALAARVAADEPTVGIGSGAALVARAAGAEAYAVDRDAEDKFDMVAGFRPVSLPFPGGTDPSVFGLAEGSPMFFWSRDGFDLPRLPPPAGYDPDKPGPPPPTGNLLVMSTQGMKNAGFRFKKKVYGFAAHFELAAADVEQVLSAHGSRLPAGTELAELRTAAERHQPRYERMGARVVENLVQFLKVY